MKVVDILYRFIYNILDVVFYIATQNFLRVIIISDKIRAYKDYIKGKRVSVCGIGISNLPLIDFLLSADALVTARDMKERELLGE